MVIRVNKYVSYMHVKIIDKESNFMKYAQM